MAQNADSTGWETKPWQWNAGGYLLSLDTQGKDWEDLTNKVL